MNRIIYKQKLTNIRRIKLGEGASLYAYYTGRWKKNVLHIACIRGFDSIITLILT